MAVEVFHCKVKLEVSHPTMLRIDQIYFNPYTLEPHVCSWYQAGPTPSPAIPVSWLLLAKVWIAPCATVIYDKDIVRAT
jgi:hypothetical protein